VKDKDTIQPSFSPFLSNDVAVTNWSRFPIYKLDFGLGPPSALRVPYAPMDGLAIVLPPPTTTTTTTTHDHSAAAAVVEVLFGLRSDQWALLKDDEDIKAFGINLGEDEA